MREDKQRRNLERLAQKRQQIHERLDRVRKQIDEKFDQKESQVQQRLNLKQERIIAAALQVLDAEGLESLSLRKLAALLDIQAPALYWYFKNKEVLIDYMAEAILAGTFDGLQPCPPDQPWQDWLVQTCQQLRGAMLAHRDGGRIVTGAHLFPALTLGKLLETCLESLISHGVDEEQASLIVSTAIHFTFGRVIEEQSMPNAEQVATFKAQFAAFLDASPHISKQMERLPRRAGGHKEFEASLRLIVR
jgi:TetR/AcrR family tetracycline transcriptional repressor